VRHLAYPLQLVVEGVERDQVGALDWIGDEAAGEPAIGVGRPNRPVEVFVDRLSPG